jgi:hypothetical protein
MSIDIPGYDEQDQAEIFDEENLDGTEGRHEASTFEDIPDFYDSTRRLGDAEDVEELDAADFEEGLIEDIDLDEEEEVVDDDVYDETDEEDVVDRDQMDLVSFSDWDEAPLEYQPDVDGSRGARGGAGGYEPRGQLDDDDLEELGYRAADEEEEEEVDRKEQSRPASRAARAPAEAKSFKRRSGAPPFCIDGEEEALHSRPADQPLPADVSFDHIAHRVRANEHRQEALIDEAVEETFPASDPISPKHIT